MKVIRWSTEAYKIIRTISIIASLITIGDAGESLKRKWSDMRI